MMDIPKKLKEDRVDYIQFQFTTILGEFKCVEFPTKIWEDMKEGAGIDGSSLGFLDTEQSDIKILPDLSTYRVLPYNKRIASFICDIYNNDGKPYNVCPRHILKRQLEKIKSQGYLFLVRPELEWYFMTKDLNPADKGTYMDMPPKDEFHELRRNICDDLIEAKIPLKTIHHEVGPSQQEVEFIEKPALFQADNVQTAKILIKIRTHENDMIASFMPKPFIEEAGNGLHIHQYLQGTDGKNIFAGEGKQISENLRYYIGGIQKHVSAISAILNPLINSYHRLKPNHEAPVFTSWGIGNRTALIRVPGYEKSARIEYRAGDSGMNIYLGIAVLLAAGMDGIKHKIEPNNPTSKNTDKLTKTEREELGIKQLPRNLKESLEACEKNKIILKVLGEQCTKKYLSLKYEELTEYEKVKPSGDMRKWELTRYLNC
ncbi:MAG: glutamine synthetase family protein [Promethearchaeota archaeon]